RRALGIGLPMLATAPEPGLRLRELEHRSAEEAEIQCPAVRVGHGADDHERRAWMGLQELGDDERAGGSGEAGDTETDFTLGERFRQRIKSRPLSQHLLGCEDFYPITALHVVRPEAGVGRGCGGGGGGPRPRSTRTLPPGGGGPSRHAAPPAPFTGRVPVAPPPPPTPPPPPPPPAPRTF